MGQSFHPEVISLKNNRPQNCKENTKGGLILPPFVFSLLYLIASINTSLIFSSVGTPSCIFTSST